MQPTALPHLSPYVRPALLPVRDEAGAQNARLVFENGLRGGAEVLSELEERIVRALWPPATHAHAAVAALCAEVGQGTVDAIIASLKERLILFDSPEQCEIALNCFVESMLPPVPLIDQVELTTYCPMKCGFCPRGIEGGMKRPRQHMSLALFERLLEQVSPGQAAYRPLELDCLGESLVHPEIHRFVEAATRHGLRTELSVNPSLLTPALAERLLTAGLSRLVISLDGMDDATLTAIRGPAAKYTAAEANLHSLFALARARPTPPSIVIQMIDLTRNRHQHQAFLAKWANTGESFVTAYIKPLDGPDPDTQKASPHPVRYLCAYPFASVSVLVDGSVVPCCRDAQGAYVLGNLNEQSLADIWNGEKARALRQAYLTNSLAGHPLCGDCPFQRKTFRDTVAERHPDFAAVEPLYG